jgi:hypothetical protein
MNQNLDPVKNSLKSWLGVPATITPVSLSLPKDLDYDSWAAIGPKLVGVKKFCTWAIADWLNWGEQRWGETYAQAVEATGLQPDYLSIIKYVGSRVDASRRREGLSFSHHRLVAKLDPANQEEFLLEAEKNNWTREGLGEAVAKFKNLPPKRPTKTQFRDTTLINLNHEIRINELSACDHRRGENPLSSHEAALEDLLRRAFKDWPIDQRTLFFETAESVLEDLRAKSR